jgi:hypothetical protein
MSEPMNYFAAISFRCQQIDDLAQAYLNQFEFMSNPDILEKLWEVSQEKFKAINNDWERCSELPEWMINFLDGWTPYAPSKNGSLYHALGCSCLSADAHLRNLFERTMGRETKELPFPILAEHEVVNKLCGLSEKSQTPTITKKLKLKKIKESIVLTEEKTIKETVADYLSKNP